MSRPPPPPDSYLRPPRPDRDPTHLQRRRRTLGGREALCELGLGRLERLRLLACRRRRLCAARLGRLGRLRSLRGARRVLVLRLRERRAQPLRVRRHARGSLLARGRCGETRLELRCARLEARLVGLQSETFVS
jgi:hypothetical protein